jgi:hypothetical protein
MARVNQRIAQPGDIFILLVPSAQELHLLRQWQADLQIRYGGKTVKHLHITSQRFTPHQDLLEESSLELLKNELQNLQPFPVFTDKLIQFYARYWDTLVLRWRVQGTDAYTRFRKVLDQTLEMIQCPSHFDRQRHASCGALNLDVGSDLEVNPPLRKFPAYLFTARDLLISKLVGDNEFEIIETIKLS